MGKLNPWARSLTTQCSRSVSCGGLCEIPDREVKLLLATAVKPQQRGTLCSALIVMAKQPQKRMRMLDSR
ncbi:uncharacterized protein B0T23DRAFT_39187 [Neurospora hispaniola]|uniref:Uncharacterized protein n=1 Tax=Neurospora hispaniola TaxID=588809 RepID=A0AAJ0IH26_9PEZI|nr:hypothetical protein B0T23DRAFT_39187 [Neurospora hispaniola]